MSKYVYGFVVAMLVSASLAFALDSSSVSAQIGGRPTPVPVGDCEFSSGQSTLNDQECGTVMGIFTHVENCPCKASGWIQVTHVPTPECPTSNISYVVETGPPNITGGHTGVNFILATWDLTLSCGQSYTVSVLCQCANGGASHTIFSQTGDCTVPCDGDD